MNVKIIIDTRKSNKEGKYPIKIRFTNKGQSTYHFLNIYSDINDFDNDSGIFLLNTKDKVKRNEHLRYNNLISLELSKIDDLLLDIKKKNIGNISASRIKDLYIKSSKQLESLTFNSFFKEFITTKDGLTNDIYQATINKIEKYFGSNIYFEDINYLWLEKFERIMQKDNLSKNSRSIHLRNIRAVINNAIDKEIIGYELYPFRRFKIEHEKTAKRNLSISQLILLFEYKGDPHLLWSRDVAKLMFYLIGINVRDLYDLSYIKNNYVNYRRAKTSTLYTIKIQPEAKELLSLFKGNDKPLCFSENMNYKSFGIRINKHLRTIGKDIGVDKLTTYNIRHTWATLAASLDIPKETIAAALGHGGNSVTDIYINFDQKKIDDANRKIINYVKDTSTKYNMLSSIMRSLLDRS